MAGLGGRREQGGRSCRGVSRQPPRAADGWPHGGHTVVHEQLRAKPRKGGAGCEEVWFRDSVVCAVSLDWLDTPVSAHGCSRDQVRVYHVVVRVR